MDTIKINQLGAIVSIAILLLSNLIFIFRLLEKTSAEYWTGIIFILTIIPLIFLFHQSFYIEKSKLYQIQLGLMITFIFLELFLDYIFNIDFRNSRYLLITYVTLFFASTGGMIGIASAAGRYWAITSIVLFLIMTILAFYQRYKTGL